MVHRRLYPSRGLHGKVAHEIGRRIVSGAVAEGAFLPREQELSEQFSVSRQAVREALKVLAAKGLVSSRRRAGTYVLPRTSWNLLDPDVIAWHPPDGLPPDFLADLIELRRLIEPAAADYAAVRGHPARVAEIDAALQAIRGCAGNPEALYAADGEFHRALFAASGNSLIDRLSTILVPVLEQSFRAQGERFPRFEEIIATHVAVLESIKARDGDGARAAMIRLLDVAITEIDAPGGAQSGG